MRDRYGTDVMQSARVDHGVMGSQAALIRGDVLDNKRDSKRTKASRDCARDVAFLEASGDKDL